MFSNKFFRLFKYQHCYLFRRIWVSVQQAAPRRPDPREERQKDEHQKGQRHWIWVGGFISYVFDLFCPFEISSWHRESLEMPLAYHFHRSRQGQNDHFWWGVLFVIFYKSKIISFNNSWSILWYYSILYDDISKLNSVPLKKLYFV